MDIKWYGHSCFRISERGKATIVTDPFDASIGYMALNLKADVVTVSHDTPGHANIDGVKEWRFIVSRPGEYEVGGVLITGTPMINRKAQDPLYNVAYLYDYGALNLVHLGDLNHVPSQSSLDALGEVHIAMVPVGGGGALNAGQAAEIISMIEPSIILPMHYHTAHSLLELDPIDKFLTEMGVTTPTVTDILRVSAGSLPEQPQIILLDYQG